MSLCTSITLVEHSGNLGDLLKVVIDNSIEAFWFYDYTQALQYVQQDVIVEFRKDIYKGEAAQFIKTITIPTVINTLDKKDNIRLYVDQVDNNANLSFSEVALGETFPNAIVFCTSNEYKSSNQANWMEFIIRDKTMHTAKLRLFDYESLKPDFAGKYIMTSLSKNKYGFQTDFVAAANGTFAGNPEIDIAEQFVRNYFSDDAMAIEYIAKHSLFENLRDVVDYEKGYAIVRMAMELSMVDNLNNITKDVNVKAIGEAILCSYGHYTHNSVLSPVINNVNIALGHKFEFRKLIVQILDEYLEEKPDEYYVMKSIKETVNTILEVRKGTK